MCAAVQIPENDEYKRTFSVRSNPIHAAETARHKRDKA